MQVNKQQFQILNALDTILNQNRQQELSEFIQIVGSDKILDTELMDLARKLKRNVVVNFLATLITHNSDDPKTAPLILSAYQSIASGLLQGQIADLPEANVVNLTVLEINKRRVQANPQVNQSQKDQSYIESLNTASKRSPGLSAGQLALQFNKAAGSVHEHILAMELAIDHGYPAISAEILKNLSRKSLRGQDQKYIADMILERGDLSAKQVQGIPWADWAECVEQALKCVRTESQKKLRGELALWGARCHVRAGQYDRSITLARKATWRTQVLRVGGEVARALCFQGKIAESIHLLDEVAKELCALTDLVGLEWLDKSSEEKNQVKKGFNVDAAGLALQDLRNTLDAASVQPFLVSGTLLGYARERGLLTHDKDVDVGVLGWEKQFEIVEALLKSRKFRTDFQALRGALCNTLVARHIETGCCIDIFLYRERDGKFVTGVDCDFGYVQEFAFTPFKLAEVDFLGTRFFVPDNINLNLTENFGDWKNPDKDYISHLESPSTVNPGGPIHMLVARLTLISAIPSKKTEKVRRVIKMLREYSGHEYAMSPSLINRIEELFGPKVIGSEPVMDNTPNLLKTWNRRISTEAVHAA